MTKKKTISNLRSNIWITECKSLQSAQARFDLTHNIVFCVEFYKKLVIPVVSSMRGLSGAIFAFLDKNVALTFYLCPVTPLFAVSERFRVE